MRVALVRGAAAAVVLAVCLSSLAFRNPAEGAFPPDLDVRLLEDANPTAWQAERAEVAQAWVARFGPRVALRWGDRSARPQLALIPGGFLGRLELDDRSDLLPALKEFLLSASDAVGLSPREVRDLSLVRIQEIPGAGLRQLRMEQRVSGVPVFEGEVRISIDAQDRVINIGGEFFPGVDQAVTPLVGPSEALSIAAKSLGLSGEVPPVANAGEGPQRWTRFEPGSEFRVPPQAHLVLLPFGGSRARLTWDVSLWEAVSGWGNLYQVLVDGLTGEVSVRRRLTLYVDDPADASGLVFEEDPEDGPQVDRSFAGDPVASPENWVLANQTLSKGLNVYSRADWGGNNNDSFNPLADGGDLLQFDFPFTDRWAQTGKIGDRDAAITNAFYIGNLYHDYFYDLGFDEPSGNHQDDNFGRGGAEGDHVNVDVQDSYSLSFIRNNANWSPTPDGTPPRTQYFMWTDPDRDGAFDAKVIWHEFSHGLSTRLVGGPASICLSGPQPGGMGEGWGDFFGVSHFSDPADDPAGPAIVGEYVTGNYDRGIRRYPYHVDPAVNPLTYADLCDNGSCEVHDEGEIWANVLWNVRHDLILEHGFEEGRHRAEQLAVDAMKLSPCNPNMVEMKDLILQADEQRYGGQDECTIRGAFARRGLGASATSNGTGSDAHAAFDATGPLGASLTWDDDVSLVWEAREGAVSYRVARGDLAAGSANAFDDAVCIGSPVEPSFQDAELPAQGDGFYYLTGVEDACGLSGFGSASDGSPRAASGCE